MGGQLMRGQPVGLRRVDESFGTAFPGRDILAARPTGFAALPVPGQLQMLDIGPALGEYFGVDQGALVVSAGADGPLRAGDILVEVDGTEISSSAHGYTLLSALTGQTELTVRRLHRYQTLQWVPGAALR